MKYLAIPVLLLLTAIFLVHACKEIGLESSGSSDQSATSQSAPYLISVRPADNEPGVPINRTILVTFNEAIDSR